MEIERKIELMRKPIEFDNYISIHMQTLRLDMCVCCIERAICVCVCVYFDMVSIFFHSSFPFQYPEYSTPEISD